MPANILRYDDKLTLMSRIAELREIVLQFDLNKHPFYTDWRAGTLPMAKLQRYADDYGHFVGLIENGWDRVGRSDYAEEERQHHELWTDFANAVGASSGARPLAETCTLLDSARTAFTAPASAIGGLYAFELQQPDTAQVKLDGLREHYKVGCEGQKYFEVHAGEWHEVADLEKLVEGLDEPSYNKARSACADVAKAMWGALDGVYVN